MSNVLIIKFASIIMLRESNKDSVVKFSEFKRSDSSWLSSDFRVHTKRSLAVVVQLSVLEKDTALRHKS